MELHDRRHARDDHVRAIGPAGTRRGLPADGDPRNDSATDAGAVSEPQVDLVVTKTAPDRAIDGMQVPYLITVSNQGVSPAPAVTVTDTLPLSFTLIGISPSQGSCTGTTCALGTLAPDHEATIIVLAQPPFPDFAGDTDFTNTAEATSGGHELDPADNRATVTRHSVDVVDAYAVATISAPVLAGGPITITLRTGNRGPQAADVHGTGDVFDVDTGTFGPLDAQATLTRGPGECVLDSPGNSFCGFPAIAAGDERIVTLNGTVPTTIGGHEIRVRLSGEPSQYESSSTHGDNSVEKTVVVQGVNVAVDKARIDGTGSVAPGGDATFRLTARNPGGLTSARFAPELLNLPATGVTVRDELPAGVTLLDAPAECTSSGRVVTCDAGTLAVNEERSFDLRVRVGTALAGHAVGNEATVSAGEPDWRPEDNHDTADLDVAPLPVSGTAASADLAVRVEPPSGRVREGDSTAWQITVVNHGPATATGVTLTAVPHGGTASGARVAQLGCRDRPQIGCDVGSLAAGAQRTITVRLRRGRPGRLALSATIRATEADTRNDNNSARAELRVRAGRATVELTMSAARDTVRAGSAVPFTITVRASGHRAGRALRVCDRSPAGLRLVRARTAGVRGNIACWHIGRLGPGQTRRLTLTARAVGDRSSLTRLVNRATLRGANVGARRAAAAVWVAPRQTRGCASRVVAHAAC